MNYINVQSLLNLILNVWFEFLEAMFEFLEAMLEFFDANRMWDCHIILIVKCLTEAVSKKSNVEINIKNCSQFVFISLYSILSVQFILALFENG